MAKLSFALFTTLAASAAAFAPQPSSSSKVLEATKFGGDDVWDPMSFSELSGDAFDTFPRMFPDKQFLAES